MLRDVGKNRPVLVMSFLAAILAIGWTVRERTFAADKAAFLKSQTVNAAELKFADHVYEGKPRGTAALYFNGQTQGTRNFVVGQFQLKPAEEPHPIHTHPEEEVLIVASGKGEIICDGVTTKIGPGSVMLTGPNVPHGIKSMGEEPLVFYFIKWIGVGR